MDPDLRRKYNERGSAADQNGQDGFVRLYPLPPLSVPSRLAPPSGAIPSRAAQPLPILTSFRLPGCLRGVPLVGRSESFSVCLPTSRADSHPPPVAARRSTPKSSSRPFLAGQSSKT